MSSYIATRGDKRPYFTHDCNKCRFRGSLVEVATDGSSQVVDVYVCRTNEDYSSIVRRFGSDGPNYASFPRRVVATISHFDASWQATLELVQTSRGIRNPRRPELAEEDGHYRVLQRLTIDRSDDSGGWYRSITAIYVYADVAASLFATRRDDAVREWLRETMFPSTRCHHDYDCCGNYYAQSPKITQLTHGKWLVSQDFTQNV